MGQIKRQTLAVPQWQKKPNQNKIKHKTKQTKNNQPQNLVYGFSNGLKVF